MIYVGRQAVSPQVLAALNKPYPKDNLTELERARAYYAQVPPPTKAYTFERYKEWAVCLALDTLFHEKCAYCESSYRAVDSNDVEHFRPKGGVTEAPLHPGYWWLAGEWTNLLPSCPPCNQKRRQLVYDGTMTLEEFENARLIQPDKTYGKANSFPVIHNNWIPDESGDVRAEDPLLINPCDRKPDLHLEWAFDWKGGEHVWKAETVTPLVRARKTAGGEDSYGTASIAVFGLNRIGLVRERRARVKEMQVFLRPIIHTMLDLAGSAAGDPKHAELTARLGAYKADFVATFTAPDRPYAGMARAFMALVAKELPKVAAAP